MLKLEDDELLTSGEAARCVGLSVETIRRLCNIGELPALKTSSGMRLFRRSELVAMVLRRQTARIRVGRGRPKKTGTLFDVVPMTVEGDFFNDE